MNTPTPQPNPTLQFAAEELRRYLLQMTGAEIAVGTEAVDGIGLRLLERPASGHPFDDEIEVAVTAGRGCVAGSNPRAVLLGVYRLLTQLGCRWVRPGAEGEIVPRRPLAEVTASLREKAAYRHRGIVIEGAVSLENVLEMVDWAPKVGFSSYFMQFREGFVFFDRWYGHRRNPKLPAEPVTLERARAYTRRIEAEIARRGLIYHAVGHGWTCEAYGIPGLGWDQEEKDYPAETVAALAQVGGVRAMRYKIPMITSLCYSQPAVLERVAAEVTRYALAHPEVDLLHVWLDDGFNNKCECAGCAGKLPADYYIDLLNAIDAQLTEKGSAQQIVFLGYQDVLWPPQSSRLRRPERFTFMFAPIGREYLEPLSDKRPTVEPPAFRLNQLELPRSVEANLAMLHAWKKQFQGDSFSFEYYFTIHEQVAFAFDPAQLHLARIIHEDVRNLRAQGLNGLLSCQLQRVFMPTGLGMTVLGRSLWDDTLGLEEITQDYFRAAFGADGGACRDYLESLAKPFDWTGLRRSPTAAEPQRGAQLVARVDAVVRAFAPVIERNRALPERTQARSWDYLHWHTRIVRGFAEVAGAHVAGDLAGRGAAWDRLKELLQSGEGEIQPALDVWSLIDGYEKIFAKHQPPPAAAP